MSLYDDIDGVPLKENNSSETGIVLVQCKNFDDSTDSYGFDSFVFGL